MYSADACPDMRTVCDCAVFCACLLDMHSEIADVSTLSACQHALHRCMLNMRAGDTVIMQFIASHHLWHMYLQLLSVVCCYQRNHCGSTSPEPVSVPHIA
jgi:hypothetical protein